MPKDSEVDVEADQSLHDSHMTVTAIKAGDEAALGRLTNELRPYLRRVIQRELTSMACRTPDDDSDLIQQTLLKAVQSVETFRGNTIDQWRVWLATFARNEVRMAVRYWNSQKRSVQRSTEGLQEFISEVPADDDGPSAEIRKQELAKQLSRALQGLSESERQIIGWRQDQGLTHAAIAERLGISVDAARQRCKSAMDNLRKLFDQIPKK